MIKVFTRSTLANALRTTLVAENAHVSYGNVTIACP